MAPELFLSKPFGNAVDVFAFGVLLKEIWAREVPWDGYQPLDIREKVTAGERPPTPRTMPYACEALVKRLWHATPALRPTFATRDFVPIELAPLRGQRGRLESVPRLNLAVCVRGPGRVARHLTTGTLRRNHRFVTVLQPASSQL